MVSEDFFACNICLDTASNPVLTRCGHLYCWPCIYRWMKVRKIEALCPVCKVQLSEENIIPIYGRGRAECTPPSTPPKVVTPAECTDCSPPLPPSLESPVPSRPRVVARTPTAPPARGAMDAALPPRAADTGGSSGPLANTLSSMLGLNLVSGGPEADLRALSPEQVCALALRLRSNLRAPYRLLTRPRMHATLFPAVAAGLLITVAAHTRQLCHSVPAAHLSTRLDPGFTPPSMCSLDAMASMTSAPSYIVLARRMRAHRARW